MAQEYLPLCMCVMFVRCFRRSYMNDVHVLDTDTWTWTQLTVQGVAPSPRDKVCDDDYTHRP
eukprot:5611757-Pyramimonas_sp.AAC.1